MKKSPNELRVKGVKKSILRKNQMLYIVESVNENWDKFPKRTWKQGRKSQKQN